MALAEDNRPSNHTTASHRSSHREDMSLTLPSVANQDNSTSRHKLLRLGSRGQDVSDLQKNLNRDYRETQKAKGLRIEESHIIRETGIFGKKTLRQLIQFQQRYHLHHKDGIAGPEVYSALQGRPCTSTIARSMDRKVAHSDTPLTRDVKKKAGHVAYVGDSIMEGVATGLSGRIDAKQGVPMHDVKNPGVRSVLARAKTQVDHLTRGDVLVVTGGHNNPVITRDIAAFQEIYNLTKAKGIKLIIVLPIVAAKTHSLGQNRPYIHKITTLRNWLSAQYSQDENVTLIDANRYVTHRAPDGLHGASYLKLRNAITQAATSQK